MNKPLNHLHEENSRLKSEINRLRCSLREYSSKRSSDVSSRSSKSPLLSSLQKENLIQNLKKKIEIGVFSPAKLASNKIRTAEIKDSGQPIKVPNSKNSDEKKIKSIKSSSKAKENIEKIKNLSDSNMSLQLSSSNNKENKQKINLPEANCSYINTNHKRLIDSFESYYESEEENLAKFGKCELSYIDYKKQHESGCRRREQKMVEEIELLRKENSLLKSKIKSLCTDKSNASSHKNMKTKSARGRSYSRNSQKSSGVRRSCVSLISLRKKHCEKCTALLSKGFSTRFCEKHNGNVKKTNLKQ